MREFEPLPDWPRFAVCRGVSTGWWFPGRGEPLPGRVRDACAVCPVADECLTAALVGVEKFGVWGGLSEKARRQLRRYGEVETSRASALWDGTVAVVVPVDPPEVSPGEARLLLLEFDAEVTAVRAVG